MLNIVRFNNKSVTEIQIQFSEYLDLNLGIPNVKISSGTESVFDLEVKSVDVTADVLTISTSPQRAITLYKVTLLDTATQLFLSKSGERLQGSRVFTFLGQERSNSIRDDMLNTTSEVYDVDSDTLIRKHISNIGEQLLQVNSDINETGNANYLSVDVSNALENEGDYPEEIVTRGFGPNDRLSNEGAYEIIRVGSTPTGTTLIKTIKYDASRATALVNSNEISNVNTEILTFPTDPISLRGIDVINETVSNTETLLNKFDGLIITLSKSNVSMIHSVSFNGSTFYNLPKYGYSIANNRYDTVYGSSLSTLSSNQFKLADAAVLEGNISVPVGTDILKVSYSYIDNGVNVDLDTIVISKVLNATREFISPISTVFSLKNFPIVDSSDNIRISAGVSFLDPNPTIGTPFSSTHPAFVSEIPFDASRLPSVAGQFSVDYNTGQVIVYGKSANDGTGNIPPVASYTYRKSYNEGIDYNSSSILHEIVVVSSRELATTTAKLNFEYEKVFASGTDFINESHIEVINEYLDNRIDLSNLSIFPLNSPITNVFNIINETTGETYGISRFDGNSVRFTGVNLPKLKVASNEQINWRLATNEILHSSERISDDGYIKVLKFQLGNSNIISSSGDLVGSNINSNLNFSRPDLFLREFFYDDVLQTQAANLNKLSVAGDYIMRYSTGELYLLVLSTQNLNIGNLSYYFGEIDTAFSQIAGVDDVSYKLTLKDSSQITLTDISSTSDFITVATMPASIERFFKGNTDKPILFGTKQFGQLGQMVTGSFEFTAADGNFNADFEDGYHILRIPNEPDRAITSVTGSLTLLVDIVFSEVDRGADWCIIDFNVNDGYSVATSYNISSVRGVYTVSDLQTNDSASLTNLYDSDLDTFSSNTITFNGTAMNNIAAGTALAIDYSFGRPYTTYSYIGDILKISYEYGDNSLNWSVSDALIAEEQYFVSYRYGALREKLLENFGSLTQIEEMTNFPLDFNRELYRRFLRGTLQAFVAGPTPAAIKNLVEHVTDIVPEVKELTFNEWTLDRDNLHLEEGVLTGTEEYSAGKFGDGLLIRNDTTLIYPEESYISYREGTFESWVTPLWNGIDNDADIIVDIKDAIISEVYIGATAFNPTEIPFTLNKADANPKSPVGQPINFNTVAGHYVWYDEDTTLWNFSSTTDGYGTINTSGQIHNFSDGYNVTSTNNYIQFDGYGDNADGYHNGDGYTIRNQFTFSSDDFHYLFDAGNSLTDNRISIFKDGKGFINFRVYDDEGLRKKRSSRVFSISSNIQDWIAGKQHFVSASWRLNSPEGIDEMHLFIDGQETSNLLRYGGKPKALSTSTYRTVANEILISSAVKTIVGGNDGVSSSNTLFTSISSTFLTDGIKVGDLLTILDSTADGTSSPYTIISVSEKSLTLSTSMLLTLTSINFSVNQAAFITSTNTDIDDFIVLATDGYGISNELNGLLADSSDYSVTRNAGTNTISINNGITVGDSIIINTLGLKSGRSRDTTYSYTDGYNLLETRGAPPTSLTHIDVFKVPLKRFNIGSDGYLGGGDGYLAMDGYIDIVGSQADGYLTTLCQPSNDVTGKAMSVTLGGIANIDFGSTNIFTVVGTTFSGSTSETLVFSNYGTKTTSNFFLTLDSVNFVFTAIDPTLSFGSIQMIENIPLTSQENNGNYGQVSGYDNGVLSFILFGSGGLDFELEPCDYLIDYPINLNISMSRKGELYIGSSIDGDGQLDGTLDQVIFLNEMLDDTRAGESKSAIRTITSDYNSATPLVQTAQTLMQLNLDKSIENIEPNYITYDGEFLTSSRSVNKNFGDSVVFTDGGLIIDNSKLVINNDSGTIEFWVSPTIDTLYDSGNNRYYFDTTSIREVQVISSTKLSISLPSRAKRIVSVRLTTDNGDGTDFFIGGELFVNGKTITLGSKLSTATTLVAIKYIPIDAVGERISIFKDPTNKLNFLISSDIEEFVISYAINWKRNTWHRVMATWRANSIDGNDQMRLFVDGVESGTILWGTPGLIYGTGIIYGTVSAGVAGIAALVADISITDTFADVILGNSFDNRNTSVARMDNFRFSNLNREPSVSGVFAVDLNYNSNTEVVLPVVEDNFTTFLMNFDKDAEETEFLSNLLDESTPLFLFEVGVDDSFKNIQDQRSQNIMTSIIERMKPAHTNSLVKFI